MTRDELRSLAVEMSKKHPHLILQWATGTGKSKAGIAIQEYSDANSTLLAVAEIAHLSNWEEQYKEYGNAWLLGTTEMFCYASLKNYVERDVDLLILDEGHHSVTDIRMDYLSTIKAKRIVILTATIDREGVQSLNELFGVKFKVHKVPLDMAIREGLLPEPKIYVVPLTLDDTIKSEEVKFTRGTSKKRISITADFSERWNYLGAKDKYPHLDLTLTGLTQQQKYDWLTDQYEYYRKRQFIGQFMLNKFLQLGSARKRFLGDAKQQALLQLKSRLEESNKRFLMFCATISQAKELGGINAIHSERDDSLEVIHLFNSGEINSLYAVGMLQEGQNLNNIEVGIIGQLDGKDRAFIQKFGRTLRAEEPIQVVLYYKNTRDEVYLQRALENVSPEYIFEVDSINNIPLS